MGIISNSLTRTVGNFRRGKNKIESLLPLYGLIGTSKLIMKNTLWFERVYRLEKNLSTPEDQVNPKIPLQLMIFSGSDLDVDSWEGKKRIFEIRGEYGIAQFKERLARGDLLFIAQWQEKDVGFVWLEFPPGEDIGYSLSMDEAYTYDGWTYEEYRGNRALPFIQQGIMNYVRDSISNICTLVTHIAVWNGASISGDIRAGYVITRLELSVSIIGYHRKYFIASRYHR